MKVFRYFLLISGILIVVFLGIAYFSYVDFDDVETIKFNEAIQLVKNGKAVEIFVEKPKKTLILKLVDGVFVKTKIPLEKEKNIVNILKNNDINRKIERTTNISFITHFLAFASWILISLFTLLIVLLIIFIKGYLKRCQKKE